ncbi:hypothetical protein DPMN_015227 [Dreissena polymorpha]|uniref:Uncharacterized protein n=1 Tax=Dreissena polymorpha TaxID=45954 RepID=A0A9D4N7E0_DREPO|nr:hypothetical protein DPMN_015227 [Dreissena polymorpha]
MTASREPPVQRPAGYPREPALRQWQPPPSQWPSHVTNSPDKWDSMDRPKVQQQFPDMNIAFPSPESRNQQRPQ